MLGPDLPDRGPVGRRTEDTRRGRPRPRLENRGGAIVRDRSPIFRHRGPGGRGRPKSAIDCVLVAPPRFFATAASTAAGPENPRWIHRGLRRLTTAPVSCYDLVAS